MRTIPTALDGFRSSNLGPKRTFSKGVGVAMPGPTAATFDVSVTGDLGSRVKRLSRRSPTPVPSSVASPQSVF